MCKIIEVITILLYHINICLCKYPSENSDFHYESDCAIMLEKSWHYIIIPGKGEQIMAESMKDYETELEASFKKIEEGDIITGTVISVDEKEVVVDLKYYTEGIIPAEDYSREPGFSLKEEVHTGDEVSATVVRKDDGNGNILLSRVEAADVLAWDKLKALKDSK